MAPHGCYPCQGEERWVSVAVTTEDQWKSTAEVLGHPEWIDDERFKNLAARLSNQDLLDDQISQVTSVWDALELTYALQKEHVPAAVSNTVRDLLRDPHLNERGFFVEIDQPEMSKAPFPKLPWRLDYYQDLEYGPAPLFGEHTEQFVVYDCTFKEFRNAIAYPASSWPPNSEPPSISPS